MNAKPGAFSSVRCPLSAAIVRAYREVFGDDVRVLLVREGGVERGDVGYLPREKYYENIRESENGK